MIDVVLMDNFDSNFCESYQVVKKGCAKVQRKELQKIREVKIQSGEIADTGLVSSSRIEEEKH